MKETINRNNPYGDDKVMAACSLFGVMDTSGKRFSGEEVIRAITIMHERSNGLGGGFAVYGLYPEYRDYYALHVMYEHPQAQHEADAFFRRHFYQVSAEEVPTRKTSGVVRPPMVWRYFLEVGEHLPQGESEEDYMVARVMEVNTSIDGAFVFSSGKDMAVFKGVGYPEAIARYFRLEEYQGYLWTAHGRFPTNTPGWWGGAHPFSLLDWTVVHNGEISSYGTNRRVLEQYGYVCTMHTDTEVVAYAVDLLMRRHRLPIEIAARVLAPPFWEEIERLSPQEQEQCRTLRQVYPGLLLNGPFTVLIARRGEMIGLTDRIRLRPLSVGEWGDRLYLSSEESAIRLVCPQVERTWIPRGGEAVVGRLKAPVVA